MVPVVLPRRGHGHAHGARLGAAQRRRPRALDRARDRRSDDHRVRGCSYRRVDRRRRVHGCAGRSAAGSDDSADARSLHHLRLRPRRAPRCGGVPRVRRSLRRPRLQRDREGGGGRARRPVHRGNRHRGRGSRQGGARSRARSRRLVRLRRRQPLHHALGALGAAGPDDRRARVRRGRREEASPCRRRSRRAAVRERRADDREPRAEAAGRGVPRRRDDGGGRRSSARGDRSRADVSAGGEDDPRSARPPRDRCDHHRAAQARRNVRHDAGARRAARGRRRPDRRRRRRTRSRGSRICSRRRNPLPADPVTQLADALRAAVGASVELERPTDASHGDYATNAALQLAGTRRQPPREIAADVAEQAAALPGVERTEIAGPGFVNLFLSDEWIAGALTAILDAGDRFGAGSPAAAAEDPGRDGLRESDGSGDGRVGAQRRVRRLRRAAARLRRPRGRARVLLQRRRRADGQVPRVGRRSAARGGAAGGRLPRRLRGGDRRRARRPRHGDARADRGVARALPHPLRHVGEPERRRAARR